MFRRAFFSGAFALVCLASSALGDVTMELTAPPPGPSLGGVYISPYTALIGPAGQTIAPITGVSTPVICDDFTTDVSINTAPWQAIVTDVASVNNGTTASTNVKFDKTSSAAQQQQDYATAALLAEWIMGAQQNGGTYQGFSQGDLSFALWGLFDPNSVDPNGPLSGNWISGSDLTNANLALNMAKLDAGSYTQYSNVVIYSPTPQSASQEYLVVRTPEAPSALLLTVDLSSLVGLILLLRRRASGAARHALAGISREA
jgi:hypothetical protein